MMRKSISVAFLGLVVCSALWFAVRAGKQVLDYNRLSTQVPVQVEKWAVNERASDLFEISAKYHYAFDGQEYHKIGAWGRPYPNPWAAERALEKIDDSVRFVWVDPKHPSVAQFQKSFPLKSVVSAVILVGLVLYFIGLGMYVRRC